MEESLLPINVKVPNKLQKLTYPDLETVDTNTITNILLIDRKVQDYETFVNSVNASTFPIVCLLNSSENEIMELCKKFPNVSRMAIASHNYDISLEYPKVTFITSLVKELKLKNIDFLACNTLNDVNWASYYNTLASETGVIVGASNDRTGNIKYGGDWVMESTGQDIEFIYFKQNKKPKTY